MSEKNPHAVALGRLGAAKGQAARHAALTPAERSRIAQIAAGASWGAAARAKRAANGRRKGGGRKPKGYVAGPHK